MMNQAETQSPCLFAERNWSVFEAFAAVGVLMYCGIVDLCAAVLGVLMCCGIVDLCAGLEL